MENASELYTLSSVAKNEVYEEKLSMFVDLLRYRFMLNAKFGDSKYIVPALQYVDGYFNKFMNEATIEQDFYISIMEYLEELEFITDCDDREFLDNMDIEFENLEECCEYRIIHYAHFLCHLDQVLSYDVLTNSSYLFINYPERLTAKDSVRMKSLILKEKNKGM